MLKYSLGIDMAGQKFDVCLSTIDDKQDVKVIGTRQFSNNQTGFKSLYDWIQKKQKNKEIPLVICMEATGVYYEQCALYLFSAGFSVSIILPNKAKKYLLSLGLKSKNDSIDAKGLSRMGAEQKLGIWQPIGTFFYSLRGLTRQLQSVQELKTMVSNQLHATELGMYELKFVIKEQKKLIATYDKLIKKLNKEIEKQLKSNEAVYAKVKNIIAIKGIGILTVAVLLAESNGFELFTSASQLVSYAGLDAVENQSGSRHGKTRISKKGNSRIRRCLFMPAFSVVTNKEPIFCDLYNRIYERTNIKMKAYVAVQKKIMVIVYALWKKNEIYKSKPIYCKEEDLMSTRTQDPNLKKIVPTKVALLKVIRSIDESKLDSSLNLQT